METKPQYKIKTGPDSMEARTGKTTTFFKFKLFDDQHAYITSRDVSAAEYLRRLIDADMRKGEG